jgi:RNA polymerase sigma-70 factor (ECF subfamily)
MSASVSIQEEEPFPSRQAEDARLIALAAAAAHGDEAAFAELYSTFSQRIFNLVLRSVHDRPTAEDLCQEIWLKVHREIRSLRAPEAIRSWLYRIASRACIDFARSSRAPLTSDELLEEVVQACDPLPEDAAIRGSEVRMVWESLATMAPRQSIALYLKQVDGRSYDEIGSILNCSRETVESLLFRARQSFVRAYDRVQSSHTERCSMFQQVVAGIVDDEPTQLQRSAIQAHLQECKACRTQLPEIAAAAKSYGALPLLSLTKGLLFEALAGGATVATTAGVAPTAAGLLTGAAPWAKIMLICSLFAAGTTAVATDQVNLPLPAGVFGAQADDSTSNGDSNNLLVNAAGATATAVASADSVDTNLNNGGKTGGSTNGGPAGPRDDAEGGGAAPNATPTPGNTALLPGGDESGPLPPASGLDGDDPMDLGELLPPTETPLGTVLNGAVGGVVEAAATVIGGTVDTVTDTLGDVTDVVGDTVDNTLDTVGDTVDTVGDTVGNVVEPLDPVLDGVTDTVDSLLPDPTGTPGPVGGLLDGVLNPDRTNTPAPTATPNASAPPQTATPTPRPCLLGIIC